MNITTAPDHSSTLGIAASSKSLVEKSIKSGVSLSGLGVAAPSEGLRSRSGFSIVSAETSASSGTKTSSSRAGSRASQHHGSASAASLAPSQAGASESASSSSSHQLRTSARRKRPSSSRNEASRSVDFSTSVSCASANVLFYTCDDPAVLTLNDVPYLVHEKLGCGASADVYRVELLIPRFTKLKFGEDGDPVLDENFRLVVEIVGEEDCKTEDGAGDDADEDGAGEGGVEDDAEKQPSGILPNSPPRRRSAPSSKDRDQSGLRQFQVDQEKRCVSSTQREPEAERSSSVILGGRGHGRATSADTTRDPDCAASDGGSAPELRDPPAPRTEADIDDSQLVPSGASYALKIVHLPADSPDQTEQLRALHAYEISLLSQLRNCKGIVHIYDSEVREKAILILLELAVCDFGTWLHEAGECEKGGVRSLSPWDVLGILFRFIRPPLSGEWGGGEKGFGDFDSGPAVWKLKDHSRRQRSAAPSPRIDPYSGP